MRIKVNIKGDSIYSTLDLPGDRSRDEIIKIVESYVLDKVRWTWERIE